MHCFERAKNSLYFLGFALPFPGLEQETEIGQSQEKLCVGRTKEVIPM